VQNVENTNTYIIQILKQKGKVLEPYNQISFQLNKPNQMFPAQIGAFNMQPQNNQINNEILSRLRGLEEKLEMLEDDEEEEETEEKNVLTGLLNNPQMQSMLMGILANVLAPSKPQAVAGIKEVNATDNDEKIKVAIDILKSNTENLGDKLIKLADMSVNNPAQYNMLVKML
jgi:formate dehydrogenase maturation protein FdhE